MIVHFSIKYSILKDHILINLIDSLHNSKNVQDSIFQNLHSCSLLIQFLCFYLGISQL